MAEEQELSKEFERQRSAGREDVSEGQMSSCSLLPEKPNAVPQKLQEIADKVDQCLALFNRVSDPSMSMSHKVTLLETALHEVKTKLNQAEDQVDNDMLLTEEGNCWEEEKTSRQNALRQAEQVIRHQRQQLQLKESTQNSDAELMPSDCGDVIQREENEENPSDPSNYHATSVIVGTGNTAISQSTINIINIGEDFVQLDNQQLIDVLKSLQVPLMSSVSEGRQKPALREISSEGASETDGEKPSMNEVMSTKDYIEDYCMYRIRLDSRNAPNYEHVQDDPCNAVAARIREIGTLMETMNPNFFGNVCNHLDVNANTDYEQFKYLGDELFRDSEDGQPGVSWGRIAALIVFTGRLALHCATHDKEDMVPVVIGWTTKYLDNNLDNWIAEHAGWDGFVEFFNKDKAGKRVQDKKSLLVTSAAISAVGLAAIACLLFKR